MKTKKLAKIALLALSFALMVGAIFAMTANAATTPEIKNMNVKYTDKFCLVYAVPAESVSGGSATLYIHEDTPTEPDVDYIKKYQVSTTTAAVDSGLDYEAYIFVTDGVEAMALDKVFYAQVVDAAGNESEVKSYSVVEYLYTRLADVDGKPNTSIQNGLYEQVIGFGTYAQKVFLKEDVLTTRTLISDYFYLTTSGCTVSGKTAGVFPQNEILKIKYDDSSVTDYTITTYEGYVGNGESTNSAVSSQNLSVSAGNRIHVKAENIARAYKDNVIGFEDETVNQCPSVVRTGSNDTDYYIGGDTYNVYRGVRVNEDTVFGKKSNVIVSTAGQSGRLMFMPKLGLTGDDIANATAIELSFDMKVDTSSVNKDNWDIVSARTDWPYYTFAVYPQGSSYCAIQFSVLDNGKILMHNVNKGTSTKERIEAIPATIYENEYNSFRFVIRYDANAKKNYIDVYVNNFTETPNATCEVPNTGVSVSALTQMCLGNFTEWGITYSIDNIWCGYTE